MLKKVTWFPLRNAFNSEWIVLTCCAFYSRTRRGWNLRTLRPFPAHSTQATKISFSSIVPFRFAPYGRASMAHKISVRRIGSRAVGAGVAQDPRLRNLWENSKFVALTQDFFTRNNRGRWLTEGDFLILRKALHAYGMRVGIICLL